MKIKKLEKATYNRLTEIWEGAVRATHDFLPEEDFEYYKSKLPLYFEHVTLYGYIDDNEEIKGFLGISDSMIEMLFVENKSRGLGIGKNLLNFAIKDLKLNKVDVNQQNQQALLFYKNFGFEEVGISGEDSEGKNYPIIHLQLIK